MEISSASLLTHRSFTASFSCISLIHQSAAPKMGCTSSIPKVHCTVGKKKRKMMNIPNVVIFFSLTWIPVQLDLRRSLRGLIPLDLIGRLSTLRNQIAFVAEDTGGSADVELQRMLEEYLPLVLGFTKKELGLLEFVEFKWRSLEERRQARSLLNHSLNLVEQQIIIPNSWFEVLSVVHMMAMLTLSEANSLLIPKDQDGSGEKIVSSDCMKSAIDLMLKASGLLEFCVEEVLIHLPPDILKMVPQDLCKELLKAISVQALGQNATLSVKRRLACEEVSYFEQAHFCLSGCNPINPYLKKHLQFIQWKYLEAKAAAYYYHGLILDKGSEPSCHISAVCCFLAADELLSNSKKTCLSFCLAVPVTRVPPPWGIMKHLHKKIPEIASRKLQMYGYLLDQEKGLKTLPDLPEFQQSLRPDEYELPAMDPAWDTENWDIPGQTLKQHLKDCDEDEMETE
ncbi:hypothetical protein RJ641_007172 [Dillenia turbinata]|uniref:BRO1 domain-containing protein n=1 Tax=Dillenia turbinata TaxID=194707 RepID=A0AAN8VEP7_9MAGN